MAIVERRKTATTVGSVVTALEEKVGRPATKQEILAIMDELGLMPSFTKYLVQKGELDEGLLEDYTPADIGYAKALIDLDTKDAELFSPSEEVRDAAWKRSHPGGKISPLGHNAPNRKRGAEL